MSFRLVPFLAAAYLLTGLAGLRPAQAATQNLRDLTQRSGYIFAGTVVAVDRAAPDPDQLPVMRVIFRVDQAVRGVQAQQLFVLREWAGLWDSGDRYRVGQHLLLFLYRPSRLGLTSPVGGSQGRFAMNASGEAVLQDARRQVVLNDSGPNGIGSSALVHKPPQAPPRISRGRIFNAAAKAQGK